MSCPTQASREGETMTNKTKHTPGPWRIGAPYGRLQTEIVNEHGIRSIATVWTGYYKDKQMPVAEILPDPEGEANAALIAAALALRGWLQWVRANLITHANYPSDVTINGLALDDAIAQATPAPRSR